MIHAWLLSISYASGAPLANETRLLEALALLYGVPLAAISFSDAPDPSLSEWDTEGAGTITGRRLETMVRPQDSTAHHGTLQHTTPRRAMPRHTTPHLTTPDHTTPTPLHTTPHHTTPRHTAYHYTTPHHTTPQYTTPIITLS